MTHIIPSIFGNVIGKINDTHMVTTVVEYAGLPNGGDNKESSVVIGVIGLFD